MKLKNFDDFFEKSKIVSKKKLDKTGRKYDEENKEDDELIVQQDEKKRKKRY